MFDNNENFCRYTTFVPRVKRFKAVQYDGNIRCLDIFPIQDMKHFFKKKGSVSLVSEKFGITVNLRDYITKEEGRYKVYSEKDFNRKYAPAPECIAENLVGALSSTRKLENWMVIPND